MPMTEIERKKSPFSRTRLCRSSIAGDSSVIISSRSRESRLRVMILLSCLASHSRPQALRLSRWRRCAGRLRTFWPKSSSSVTYVLAGKVAYGHDASLFQHLCALGTDAIELLDGIGCMNLGMSAGDTVVRPSGFLKSEASFATTLFGARPIEHVSFSRCSMSCFISDGYARSRIEIFRLTS